MSYQTSQRVPLSKDKGIFSGGFVDNVTNVDLAPHYSPYLRNCRLDGQSICTRPWFQLFASLTAWSYPKGIWSYLRTVSSNDRLVVRHNTDSTHKLYTIAENGTTTSIDTSTNIASDNRMYFQNIWDVIYCMNWSDNYWKLSWTTYTTPSTWISNFAPAFSVVFNSSMRASGRPTNPNKVYKSVWNNYEDFSSTWSDQFTFWETLTGLSVASQSLFYFTKNTISVTGSTDITDSGTSVSYITRALETKEGAVCNASIVEVGNNVYYLTPSNAINMIARGENVYGFDVISLTYRKYSGINKIMSSLDKDQSQSFGYYLPSQNLIKWHLKTAWAWFNDICIIYDIIKDAWLVDDQKYFYDGVFFKGKNYTISMIEPKVYQDEYGQTDENSAIQFHYKTKEFYISEPTLKKILWESRTLLDINELATVTQNIIIDWWQKDTKTIWLTNYIDSWWGGVWDGGIWTWSIGDDAIGDEWWDDAIWYIGDDDYVETYILRTKGNLNKKWSKFQFERLCSSFAWKVRLKNLESRFEILDWLATNLTQ